MDAQYFINKFEAIPEEKWTVGTHIDSEGRRCALGHMLPEDMTRETWEGRIGGWTTPEGKALVKLFDVGAFEVAYINNGNHPTYQQATPKQRILAALRDIQALEEQDKAVEEAKEIVARDPREVQEETEEQSIFEEEPSGPYAPGAFSL